MDIPLLRHPCSSHTGQKTRHLWNHSTTAQISHSCQWNWSRRGHNSQTVAARERVSVGREMLTGVVSRSLQPLMTMSRVKLGVYSDWDGDIRPAWRRRCPGGQLTPGFMAALGADKGSTRRWIKNRFIRRYHSRYCCLAAVMAGLSCDYRTWSVRISMVLLRVLWLEFVTVARLTARFRATVSKLVAYHLLIIRLIVVVNYDLISLGNIRCTVYIPI